MSDADRRRDSRSDDDEVDRLAAELLKQMREQLVPDVMLSLAERLQAALDARRKVQPGAGSTEQRTHSP